MILGEAYRSSRKDTKRRDMVAEKLSNLEDEVQKLKSEEKVEVNTLEERYVWLKIESTLNADHVAFFSPTSLVYDHHTSATVISYAGVHGRQD